MYMHAAEQLGGELVRLLGVKGQHKKRICELLDCKVKYSYEERTEIRSVFLTAGVPTYVDQISSTRLPVTWYQAAQTPQVHTEELVFTKEAVGPKVQDIYFIATNIAPQHGLVVNNKNRTVSSMA